MKPQSRFRLPLVIFTVLMVSLFKTYAKTAPVSYFQLKVYHYKTNEQKAALDTYLQQAYVPALHRNGFKQVGVFSTLAQDTADRRVYVFIPFGKFDDMQHLEAKLAADKKYVTDAKGYTDALYTAAPYNRLEVMILKAFAGMPGTAVPSLTASKADRIYELRSYESPTEKYHADKVGMFDNGEISIFNRLGFNAVFYSSVVAGGHMPNLVYMIAFANQQEREKHWNAFRDDAEWKAMSAKTEHDHNVSKIESTLLQSAEYSDF